jgi:intracellular sulfur oxidation DsrE/DsrF family protein
MSKKLNKAMAVFLGVVLLWSMNATADERSFGPVIEGYGPTYPINDRDVPLRENIVYKAVFDSAANPDETKLNTGLVSVARYLNMHARNGVLVDNMNIAVVVHGPALKTLLTDDSYFSRYGIDNPNTELVQKLHAAGVRFYVCGQSVMFGGFEKEELVGPAKVALSAMTMMTELQSDGYALLR